MVGFLWCGGFFFSLFNIYNLYSYLYLIIMQNHQKQKRYPLTPYGQPAQALFSSYI